MLIKFIDDPQGVQATEQAPQRGWYHGVWADGSVGALMFYDGHTFTAGDTEVDPSKYPHLVCHNRKIT